MNLVQKKYKRICVRQMITVAFSSAKREDKTMDLLFKTYKRLAKTNNAVISSLTDFKPTMETYLCNYRNKNRK